MESAISFGRFADSAGTVIPTDLYCLTSGKHPGLLFFPASNFLVYSTGVTMTTLVKHLMAALAIVS